MASHARSRLVCALAIAASVAGCDSTLLLHTDGEPLLGAWHSEQLTFIAESQGATARFGCAHGWTAQPIRLDASGRFTAPGSIVIGAGGAMPIGWAPDTLDATYAGVRTGDRLVIVARIGADTVGPIALTRGGPERLILCA